MAMLQLLALARCEAGQGSYGPTQGENGWLTSLRCSCEIGDCLFRFTAHWFHLHHNDPNAERCTGETCSRLLNRIPCTLEEFIVYLCFICELLTSMTLRSKTD